MTRSNDDNAFHIVLTRGRWAKVLPEDRFDDVATLQKEGWEVVWDSARSPEEGFRHAAANAQCLQEDYDDDHHPKPMQEERVLFRSVSLPELVDVISRGAVSGAGNRFNEFDSRPFAFFGDRVTDSLMFQGEDLERQAMTALSGEQVFVEFEHACRQALDVSSAFANECERLREAGLRTRAHLDVAREIKLARSGSDLAMSRLANGFYGRQTELDRLKDKADGLEAQISELRRRYQAMAASWLDEEKLAREKYPFTSAIVETRPISHGFHYSLAFGSSGMGDDDEFGFHKDSVRLDDIVRVHCVAGGRVLRTAKADDLEALRYEIEEFMAEARRPEPAFPA